MEGAGPDTVDETILISSAEEDNNDKAAAAEAERKKKSAKERNKQQTMEKLKRAGAISKNTDEIKRNKKSRGVRSSFGVRNSSRSFEKRTKGKSYRSKSAREPREKPAKSEFEQFSKAGEKPGGRSTNKLSWAAGRNEWYVGTRPGERRPRPDRPWSFNEDEEEERRRELADQ